MAPPRVGVAALVLSSALVGALAGIRTPLQHGAEHNEVQLPFTVCSVARWWNPVRGDIELRGSTPKGFSPLWDCASPDDGRVVSWAGAEVDAGLAASSNWTDCSWVHKQGFLFIPMSSAFDALEDLSLQLPIEALGADGASPPLDLVGLGLRESVYDLSAADLFLRSDELRAGHDTLVQTDFLVAQRAAATSAAPPPPPGAGVGLLAYMQEMHAQWQELESDALHWVVLRTADRSDASAAWQARCAPAGGAGGAEGAEARLGVRPRDSSVVLRTGLVSSSQGYSDLPDPLHGAPPSTAVEAMPSHTARLLDAECLCDGSIALTPQPDADGAVLPDFSAVGYRRGQTPPAVAVGGGFRDRGSDPVRPSGDGSGATDLAAIQGAINDVCARPRRADGFRGVVELERGIFHVGGTLRLNCSGVVLRGQGTVPVPRPPENFVAELPDLSGGATLVRATESGGYGGTIRLFEVSQSRSGAVDGMDGAPRFDRWFDSLPYPVGAAAAGATELPVADAHVFAAGDRVYIRKRLSEAWLAALQMDAIPECGPDSAAPECRQWSVEGSGPLGFERTVVGVEPGAGAGGLLRLDAPIMVPLGQAADEGGAEIVRLSSAWAESGRVSEVGIEDLTIDSVFKPRVGSAMPLGEDEAHLWDAITFGYAEHAWARRVSCYHHANGCVRLRSFARAVSVLDAFAADPVSKLRAGRRGSFFTDGALSLFARCNARHGRSDFGAGDFAAGPNVWTDCHSSWSWGAVGPRGRYAMGQLYDGVSGRRMIVANRGNSSGGVGWSGVSTVFWNGVQADQRAGVAQGAARDAAFVLDAPARGPARARNYAVGMMARRLQRLREEAAQARPLYARGGSWDSVGLPVFPASLYEAQLSAATGRPYRQCPQVGGRWVPQSAEAASPRCPDACGSPATVLERPPADCVLPDGTLGSPAACAACDGHSFHPGQLESGEIACPATIKCECLAEGAPRWVLSDLSCEAGCEHDAPKLLQQTVRCSTGHDHDCTQCNEPRPRTEQLQCAPCRCMVDEQPQWVLGELPECDPTCGLEAHVLTQSITCSTGDLDDCDICLASKPRPQQRQCEASAPCGHAYHVRFSVGGEGYFDGVRGVELYAAGVGQCSPTRENGQWDDCGPRRTQRAPSTLGASHYRPERGDWVLAQAAGLSGDFGIWTDEGDNALSNIQSPVRGMGKKEWGSPRTLIDDNWSTTFTLHQDPDGNCEFTLNLGKYYRLGKVRIADGVHNVETVHIDFLDEHLNVLWGCPGTVQNNFMELPDAGGLFCQTYDTAAVQTSLHADARAGAGLRSVAAGGLAAIAAVLVLAAGVRRVRRAEHRTAPRPGDRTSLLEHAEAAEPFDTYASFRG